MANGKGKRASAASRRSTKSSGSNSGDSGGLHPLEQMAYMMQEQMSKNYVSLGPDSSCDHGCDLAGDLMSLNSGGPTFGSDFMIPYEDALNNNTDELLAMDGEAAHKKVIETLKGNVAWYIWNNPEDSEKLCSCLVALGTNYLLKGEARLAKLVKFAVVALEKRMGDRNATEADGEDAIEFFEKRIDCSCLKDNVGSGGGDRSQRQEGGRNLNMDSLLRSVVNDITSNETQRLNADGKCDHGLGKAIGMSAVDATIPPPQFLGIQQKFMPEFENTMNGILGNTQRNMHGLKMPPETWHAVVDNPLNANRVILTQLKDSCTCLPDVGNKDVCKLLSACLVSLGTDYLLQSKKHRTDEFVRRANIVAVAALMYEGNHSRDLLAEARAWRTIDVNKASQFFKQRNGCDCLGNCKEEDAKQKEQQRMDDEAKMEAALASFVPVSITPQGGGSRKKKGKKGGGKKKSGKKK